MLSKKQSKNPYAPLSLEEMPVDVVWEILSHMPFKEIMALRITSHRYEQIIDDYFGYTNSLDQLSLDELRSLRKISNTYKQKVDEYLLSKLEVNNEGKYIHQITIEQEAYCLSLQNDAKIVEKFKTQVDSASTEAITKLLEETLSLSDIMTLDPILLAKAILKKEAAECENKKENLQSTAANCLPYLIMLYAIMITKAKTMKYDEFQQYLAQFKSEIQPLLSSYYDGSFPILWHCENQKKYVECIIGRFTVNILKYEALKTHKDKSILNLAGVSFADEDLSKLNFRHINLENANLSNTNLKDNVISNVNLEFANLKNASLINTTMFKVNVRKSNLNNVDLRLSHIEGHYSNTLEWLDSPIVSKYFNDTVRNGGKAGFKQVLDQLYFALVFSYRHVPDPTIKKKLQANRDHVLQYIIAKIEELQIPATQALEMMDDFRAHKISGLNSKKPTFIWTSERKKMKSIFTDFYKKLEVKVKEEKTMRNSPKGSS